MPDASARAGFLRAFGQAVPVAVAARRDDAGRFLACAAKGGGVGCVGRGHTRDADCAGLRRAWAWVDWFVKRRFEFGFFSRNGNV